jgi:hypothetical protein
VPFGHMTATPGGTDNAPQRVTDGGQQAGGRRTGVDNATCRRLLTRARILWGPIVLQMNII